jgi:hypothetical protein
MDDRRLDARIELSSVTLTVEAFSFDWKFAQLRLTRQVLRRRRTIMLRNDVF